MFRLEPVLSDLHRRFVISTSQLGCQINCLDCQSLMIPLGFHLVCQQNELHRSIPLRLHLEEIARIEELHRLFLLSKQNWDLNFQRRCESCDLDLVPIGEYLVCPLDHGFLSIVDYLEEYRIYVERVSVLHQKVHFIETNCQFELQCTACDFVLRPRGENMECAHCEPSAAAITIELFFQKFKKRWAQRIELKRIYADMMESSGFRNLYCRICKSKLIQEDIYLCCPRKNSHQLPIGLSKLQELFSEFINRRNRVARILFETPFTVYCDSCSGPMTQTMNALVCIPCKKEMEFISFLNLYDVHVLLQLWRDT